MKELIAKSYWRSIQRGTRTFGNLPDEEVKSLVRALAQAEVQAGTLTEARYEALIGEPVDPGKEQT